MYELKCTLCAAVDTGTTGNSVNMRVGEQMRVLRQNNQEYAMKKHFHSKHPQQDRDADKLFTVRIVDRVRPSNLDRYISEGLKIEKVNKAGKKN